MPFQTAIFTQIRAPTAEHQAIFHALAVRIDNGWGSFIVVSRKNLQELWNDGCGSENEKSGDLQLRIKFRRETAIVGEGGEQGLKFTAHCGEFNLTEYINAWESLPPLSPLAPLD